MPIILAAWKAEIGRIEVQGQPGQTVGETPIFKETRAKWTGGVAQVVEHFASMKPWVQPQSHKKQEKDYKPKVKFRNKKILAIFTWAY
jgi:hypothetical protein